jgi:predicted N-acetyltransferase YhbS
VRYVAVLDRARIVEATRQHHALWGSDLSPAAHTARVLGRLEAAGPELLRYVGLVDQRGRLVSSMLRYSLLLREGAAATVRAVGIGAVFTAPRARGRGAASELLRAVMEEARDLGYEAALLYSDIDPAFYARLGFVALPARDFRVEAARLPEDGGLAVRRAGERDEARLLDWFEEAWQRAHPSFLRPARTRAIWRYFRFRNRIAGPWILRFRGREAGYLMAGPDAPTRDLPERDEPRLLWFDEVAAPSVPAERIWATVRALARRAGAVWVRGWLGPGGAPPGSARIARPASFPMIAPLTPILHVRPRRAWLDSFQHF